MISILLISLFFPTIYSKLCSIFQSQLLTKKAILIFIGTSLISFIGVAFYQLNQPNLFTLTGVNRHTPQQKLRSRNLGILSTNLGRWAYDQFDEQNQDQLRKYMQDFTLDQIILTDAYSNFFRALLLTLRDRHHLMVKLNIVFAIGLLQSYITSTALARLSSPLSLPGSFRVKDLKTILQLLSIFSTLMVSFYRQFCQISQGEYTLITIKKSLKVYEMEYQRLGTQEQQAKAKRIQLGEAIQDLKGRLVRLKKLVSPANVGVINFLSS